jgi:metal-responsive CopG/Arc/MetJ family transcriptional regulator
MRSKKIKISVSLDAGLVDWIDKKVDDFTFQNRSDGLEKAIFKLKTDHENGEKNTHNSIH